MSESLGKTLKKIRESRHLSLEEVSERTRIPKKIISAIEEDRLHELSSVFYARGFVKTYSQFLGGLEEKAVKEYLSTGQTKAAPQLILKGEKVPGDWFIKHRRHIGAGILAVFSAYILFFSFSQVGKFIKNACANYKTRAVERKAEREKEKAAKVAEIALSKPSKTKEKATTVEVKAKGVEIEVVARYNTWVQVVGDGTLLFRGAIRKGTSDTWSAKKKIELELGNAGGVTLAVNGKDLGVIGKKGEKKTLIVTEDGIKP